MARHSFFIRYKLHHLVFWLAVLGTWFFLRSGDYASPWKGFWVTLIKVADLALMIYITNYILIPRLLYKKRYGWFALIFVGMIFLSSVYKMSLIGHLTHNPALYNWSGQVKQRIYDNIIPHYFLVIAGAAVKLLYDYGQLQKRMAETAREKAEAELNFLKLQINPHFLFNSLNAVYFQIHKENTEARATLHKFSEMLRLQLYEMNGDRIPIEKEIVYLKDYVYLQQLRRDEHYKMEFHCGAGVTGFSIEPLLLVPLVENAFKHISHYTEQANYIRVNLSRQNGCFEFHIQNTKETGTRAEMKTGGIGLANVRRRLELLYPNKHSFEVKDAENQFSVHLKLDLS